VRTERASSSVEVALGAAAMRAVDTSVEVADGEDAASDEEEATCAKMPPGMYVPDVATELPAL